MQRRCRAFITSAVREERGITLLETIVALALLSAIAVAFLSGLATETKATVIFDEQTTAESLARSEMEYVKHLAYQAGATEYPVDPALSPPAGWTVLPCTVAPLHASDDGIQKLTVTIQHNGRTVFTLLGYKTD